jgi:hypothetical protein
MRGPAERRISLRNMRHADCESGSLAEGNRWRRRGRIALSTQETSSSASEQSLRPLLIPVCRFVAVSCAVFSRSSCGLHTWRGVTHQAGCCRNPGRPWQEAWNHAWADGGVGCRSASRAYRFRMMDLFVASGTGSKNDHGPDHQCARYRHAD